MGFQLLFQFTKERRPQSVHYILDTSIGWCLYCEQEKKKLFNKTETFGNWVFGIIIPSKAKLHVQFIIFNANYFFLYFIRKMFSSTTKHMFGNKISTGLKLKIFELSFFFENYITLPWPPLNIFSPLYIMVHFSSASAKKKIIKISNKKFQYKCEKFEISPTYFYFLIQDRDLLLTHQT